MKSRFTGESSAVATGLASEPSVEAKPGQSLELKEQVRGTTGKLADTITKLTILGSKMLDPKRVRVRAGFERDQAEYTDAEFLALKDSIADSKGNLAPIDVRILTNVAGFDAELLSGTRRLMACRELKLDVLANVRDCDDRTADRIHEIENKHRKNKSPYSRGLQYKSMWDSKRYASYADMASAIQGRDQDVIDSINLIEKAPEGMWAKVSNPGTIKTTQTRQLMAAYKSPVFAKAVADARELTVDQVVALAANALKPAPVSSNDTTQTRLAKRGKDYIVKLPAGISKELAEGAAAAAKKFVDAQRK